MNHRTPEPFESLTDLERKMLDAARSDRVPSALHDRMAQAVAASPAALGAAGTVRTAAEGAAAASHTARGLLFSPSALWGTLSAAVLIGFVTWQAASSRSTHEPPAPRAAAVARAPEIATPSPATEPAQPSAAVAPARSAPQAARPSVSMAPKVASSANMTGRLREELALLDGARGALTDRDPTRALALLDQHSTRFGNGSLGPEAEALRIDALIASGSNGRAARLSQRFLARHPSHPLAEHIASGSAAAGR